MQAIIDKYTSDSWENTYVLDCLRLHQVMVIIFKAHVAVNFVQFQTFLCDHFWNQLIAQVLTYLLITSLRHCEFCTDLTKRWARTPSHGEVLSFPHVLTAGEVTGGCGGIGIAATTGFAMVNDSAPSSSSLRGFFC